MFESVAYHTVRCGVRTVFCTHAELVAVCRLLFRTKIDCPAHCIGTIQHRSRSANYFHAFDIVGRVGVGHRVTVDWRILRMSVDKNEESSRTARKSTHGNVSRRSRRNPVAGNALRVDE